MNRSRITGDLVSQNNIFVDIANDRVGIGSTIPGEKLSLPDSAKIALGDSADLKLYHNTSDYIQSSSQYFYIGGENVMLTNAAANEITLKAIQNGAVQLYHNNSKKFETSSTGATVTGALIADQVGVFDNEAIYAGASSDIQMYHDASGSVYGTANSSYIKVQGVHDNILDIFTASATGKIRLKSNNLAETMLSATGNGAVELYYDNVKKLATTSEGCQITSTHGSFLEIRTSGAHDPVLMLTANNNNSTDWTIRNDESDSNKLDFRYNGSKKMDLAGDGDLTLTSNSADANAGPEFKLFRNSASPADADYLGQIKFAGESDTGAERNYAKITGKILDASNGTEDGILEFAHIKAGSQVITGRWRSDSLQLLNSTNFSVAGTSEFSDLATFTKSGSALRLNDGSILRLGNDDADFFLYHDGSSTDYISAGTGRQLRLTTDDFIIKGANNTETLMAAAKDGAVELYYDNDKKCYTGPNGLKFDDNKKALFGNSADLEIFHNGTNSFISNTTGIIQIDSDDRVQVNATEFRVKNAADTETIAKFIQDGACELYHNNVKKFETTSSGADVTGRLMTDGVFVGDGGDNDVSVSMGANNDLRLYHDGSHSYIKDRGTGNLYIESNHVNIDTDHGEQMINCIKNGAVELYHDNAKKFETYSGGAKVHHTSFTTLEVRAETNDALVRLTSQNNDDNDWVVQNDYSEGYRLDFRHNNDRKMHLDSSGNLTITGHFDVGDGDRLRLGNSDDLQLYHDGSNSYIDCPSSGAGHLIIKADDFLVQGSNAESMISGIENGAVELYHDNSKKFETVSNGIKVSGQTETTGDMVIGGELNLMGSSDAHKYLDCRIGGNSFHIRKTTGGDAGHEIMAYFHGDAEVGLYYNNSKKFETTNTGISVSGNVVATGNMQVNDNNYLYAGNGGDLRLSHNGSHSFINNQTGDLSIQSDGNLKLEAKDGGDDYIHCIKDGAVEIHYNGAKRIETTAEGVKIVGVTGSNPTLQIKHSNVDVEGEFIRVERMVQPTIRYHSIKARHSGSTNSNHISFHVHSADTTTAQTEALKILGSGNLTYSQQATTILANPNDVSLIDDGNDNNNPIHFASTYVNKGGMSVTESRSRITVPLYGTYLVTGCLSGSVTTESQGDGIQIAILKNGSYQFASGNDGTFPVESFGTENGMEYGFTVALPVVASANDYFELTFLNIGASEGNLARGYFSVTKLH